ncbi:3'-phosphoesterase [Candidatus Daviesbacteria bacterium]|nr:3'-phosphoesterase [Candidatus Daviesbacteria bacterium]
MTKNLAFVVQKHDATSLHFDFRLEINGVMPSWAIPKGPTLDPKLKRLAMKTTDHDLEYRHFEGTIEEGRYGAGPVMIWDEGWYQAEKEIGKGEREIITDSKEGEKAMEEGVKKGEVKFLLHGKKLKGSFALVKTKNFGPKNAWLLIKHQDKYCQPNFDANNYDFSAISKKSLEQISSSKNS